MINFAQMMNNPMIKTIMSSQNPQQMALNMLKNSPNVNTEIGKNVISLIERGDMKSLEQYGKNLLQSQGINPEDVVNYVKNMPK